jgi:hypothetical protein
LFDKVERDHDPGRLGKGREITGEPAGADAIEDDGAEHDQPERCIGLQVRSGRFDAGYERRPVRKQHEHKDCADQRAIRRGVHLHGVANLAVDRSNQNFKRSLALAGSKRQATGHRQRKKEKHRHDAPGDDHEIADRDRADVE